MVSPESMTQSARSKTALAPSVISARVGTGWVIIDSSLGVAMSTGLPRANAGDLTARRWMTGSSVEGALDAEIAPGHHDGVRGGHNFVQVATGGLVLDLGDDPGLGFS